MKTLTSILIGLLFALGVLCFYGVYTAPTKIQKVDSTSVHLKFSSSSPVVIDTIAVANGYEVYSLLEEAKREAYYMHYPKKDSATFYLIIGDSTAQIIKYPNKSMLIVLRPTITERLVYFAHGDSIISKEIYTDEIGY